MQITIRDNFPEVQRQLDGLRRDIAEKALVRAVNRTVEQAKTGMSREIRAEFNITKQRVDSTLRIKRANFRAGLFMVEAELISSTKRGRSLNLIHVGAKQTRKGVTFKIKRNGPRQLIPGAFIANGGRTVFIRKGKSRLPIEARQTIDVPQMFNAKRVNAKVVATIQAKFPEIFEREVRFYTQRLGR